MEYPYYWAWNKWLGEYKDTPCKLIATGALNQVMIEFEDGTRHITLRYGLRKRSNT